VQKADFDRLLKVAPWSRSTHFVVHHVPNSPWARRRARPDPQAPDLSTILEQAGAGSVDKSAAMSPPPRARWLGCTVPKRLARRAVTRSLLKRAIRSAFDDHASRLPFGLWLVRLRSGFVSPDFVSAGSTALARAARAELDLLLVSR
jgi:ribonuclease P protein component